MKKFIFILIFIPLSTLGQALFLPITLKNAESKKGIENIRLNSEWANDASTDSNGKAELSFILDKKDRYVLLNIESKDYRLSNQNQLFVPTNWNSTFPWEIKMLKTQSYIANFKQYFKAFQEFLIHKNTKQQNPTQILSGSYLLAKELMAYQYSININFAKTAFTQIKKQDFKQAYEELDSAKISFFEANLANQKANLDSFRPDYEYLLQNIQVQRNQIQKIKNLKFLLSLLSENKNIKQTQNLTQSYFLQLYKFARTQNYKFNLTEKINSIQSPLFEIKFKLLNALSLFLSSDFSSANKALLLLNKQLNNLNTSNLLDFKEITQSYIALNKSKKENKEQRKLNLQNTISNLSDNTTTQWLKILLFAQNQDENDFEKIRTSLLTPNLQAILCFKSFQKISTANFRKLDFKANFTYYNQIFSLLKITKLPQKQTDELFVLFYDYYLENSLLNNTPDSLSLFLSRHSKFGSKNPKNIFIQLGKTGQLSTQNSTNKSLKNLAETFKTYGHSSQYILASKNLNKLKDLNYKYWLKSVLLMRYTQFLVKNNTEELTKLNYYDFIDYHEESPFELHYLYLKRYFYKFNLQKAQNLANQDKIVEALDLLQPLTGDLEEASTNYPENFGELNMRFNYEIAKLLITKQQFTQAFEYLNFSVDQISKEKDNNLKFKIYLLKGHSEMFLSLYDAAINDFNLALSLSKTTKTNISSELYSLYSDMAKIYNLTKENTKALVFLKKAESSISTDSLKQSTLISEAKIHIRLKQFILALKKLEQAQSYTTNNVSLNKIEITNLKSQIYIKQRVLKQAISILETEVSNFTSIQNPKLNDKLSNSYYLLGEIYLSQDKLKLAMQNYEYSYKIRQVVYESRPGKYEVKIAEAMLKYSISAYKLLQKNLNQDIHKRGLEKVGIAISIFKKYNSLSVKNQSNLQYALKLRNDFEAIVF